MTITEPERDNRWMRELAEHYRAMRARDPRRTLAIVFDIDGTIVDMRYTIAATLRAFDRAHGTSHFRSLRTTEIEPHETSIAPLLHARGLEPATIADIEAFYERERWGMDAMRHGHRPFAGVLEVIRWFQLQPRTNVAIVTGRTERFRAETLRQLEALGDMHKVRFHDHLLFMRREPGASVPAEKVAAIGRIEAHGDRVVAFVDNERENLEAVAASDPSSRILLLHADTIFASRPSGDDRRVVAGRDYDITQLIEERDLPTQIQFVWHGVNDRANLAYFLASQVRWGELDVRRHPHTDELVLQHDPFEFDDVRSPHLMTLDECLAACRSAGRGVKLDLKEGGDVLDRVLDTVRRHGFRDRDLWWNGNLETLGAAGFQRIARAHPRAILQCPAGFLMPLLAADPEEARRLADHLVSWGINRFSLDWSRPGLRDALRLFTRWRHDVNLYNVPDLEGFLQAVLLAPRSVTSDFNFPTWRYYGRGSGAGGAGPIAAVPFSSRDSAVAASGFLCGSARLPVVG
jgi:phosphoglycolate phosphatase-like HAD superfamily hydrolase